MGELRERGSYALSLVDKRGEISVCSGVKDLRRGERGKGVTVPRSPRRKLKWRDVYYLTASFSQTAFQGVLRQKAVHA